MTGQAADDLPPAVLLMGPTAAGKTEVAMALAQRMAVSLISVDSAQVYRGLDIGSAKPDAKTLERFPHALIDIRDPEEIYSAADFAADAAVAIRAAHEAGRLPVLVGGTTMYFRSLVYGLDPMPAANPEVRAAIAAEAERQGWPALHAELARHDPASATRIGRNDPQRIQRALEVLRLSGHGPSTYHRDNRVPRLTTLRLVLTASDRHILHERIGRRFQSMLEAGLVEEVASLRARPGLTLDHPSMRSVGYRQVWQHLNGEFDLEVAKRKAAAATRQLAKRQLTSLRQFQRALWYDPGRKRTIDLVFRQVGEFEKRVDKC